MRPLLAAVCYNECETHSSCIRIHPPLPHQDCRCAERVCRESQSVCPSRFPRHVERQAETASFSPPLDSAATVLKIKHFKQDIISIQLAHHLSAWHPPLNP